MSQIWVGNRQTNKIFFSFLNSSQNSQNVQGISVKIGQKLTALRQIEAGHFV